MVGKEWWWKKAGGYRIKIGENGK
jgi:hypothetical protein